MMTGVYGTDEYGCDDAIVTFGGEMGCYYTIERVSK
jgi:hypothetical protein